MAKILRLIIIIVAAIVLIYILYIAISLGISMYILTEGDGEARAQVREIKAAYIDNQEVFQDAAEFVRENLEYRDEILSDNTYQNASIDFIFQELGCYRIWYFGGEVYFLIYENSGHHYGVLYANHIIKYPSGYHTEILGELDEGGHWRLIRYNTRWF